MIISQLKKNTVELLLKLNKMIFNIFYLNELLLFFFTLFTGSSKYIWVIPSQFNDIAMVTLFDLFDFLMFSYMKKEVFS